MQEALRAPIFWHPSNSFFRSSQGSQSFFWGNLSGILRATRVNLPKFMGILFLGVLFLLFSSRPDPSVAFALKGARVSVPPSARFIRVPSRDSDLQQRGTLPSQILGFSPLSSPLGSTTVGNSLRDRFVPNVTAEGSTSGSCEGSRGQTEVRITREGAVEGSQGTSTTGRQHSLHFAGGPSRGEINSFFRFLEASLSPHQPQQQSQQRQQRSLSLSAAVDAILFLAGCAVSPHCSLRISKGTELHPRLGEGLDASSALAVRDPQTQQKQDGWVLLCSCSPSAGPPEVLPLHIVTSLLTSLQQLVSKLQRSGITRLLPPLFLLGRTLGMTGGVHEAPMELRALARALVVLLKLVLQRAAEEAPLLPAAELVQRLSGVSSALKAWCKRGSAGGPSRLIPLLLLAQSESSCLVGDISSSQFPVVRSETASPGASALATALQRSGAPVLPHELLQAAANLMEAGATAAAKGLSGAELLHSKDLLETNTSVFHQTLKNPSFRTGEQQKRQQQSCASGLPQEPAEALSQLLTANAAWLPVYYQLMRANGGIWLPALQPLAEAAASQTTRLIELFLSQQQQVRVRGETSDEAQHNAWGNVSRLLYGEIQQLVASLARVHSYKQLRGVRRLAEAAESFDRYLSFEARSPASNSAAAAAGAAWGTSPLLRPLLHTRDSPRDLKEAERRIRFFCSLVTLGVGGREITSGVAACLPSEGLLHTLSPLEAQEQQQQSPKRRIPNQSAEAVAATCARELPLQLLQRLLVSCSWIGETSLVARGLKVLRLRLETLTLRHLVRANALSRSSSRSSSRQVRRATATSTTSERFTAELVGKTLALLLKFASCPARRASGDAEGESAFVTATAAHDPQEPFVGQPRNLQDVLCGLASTATIWAAVTGFDRQNPEDIALLTFSLIPFWLQHGGSAVANPVHTEQHVQHLRAAAATDRNHQTEKQQPALQKEQQHLGITEQQLADLVQSLRGARDFFMDPGVGGNHGVSSAAVEFYLSELGERRGLELPLWPSPLLFLLAYNILRLRQSGSSEAEKSRSRSAAAATVAVEPGGAVAAAAELLQQQLSRSAEAAAAQLLLRVVSAIEEAVTFPDVIELHCKLEGPQVEGARGDSVTGTLDTRAETVARAVSFSETATAHQCNICQIGLREVGSFLWALSRAEGGCGSSVEIGATDALQPVAASEPWAAETSLQPPCRQLTLQEASRIAARSIRRRGGFADKLAVYCEAAIQTANERRLQRSSKPAQAAITPHSRRQNQNTSAIPVGGGSELRTEDVSAQSAYEALQAFCRETLDSDKPAVTLRSSDLPSLSWLSTAGVSLGLLLKFYSTCRPDVRHHILSAVLRAPLLAAECGLLQLFHLLRPLANYARAEMEAAWKGDSKPAVSPDDVSASLPSRLHTQQQTPVAESLEQQCVQGNGRNNSGLLGMLKEAPAFIFALAVGLLRHAQAISILPPDMPHTASQVQLLLLAASDFSVLLHAHCRSSEASQKLQNDRRSPIAQPALVKTSNAFREVLHAVLSLFSSIVIKHSEQIRGSLALLAAAAEVFSQCGRRVPLPFGSRKAMEAFAPAAIAALRQPASPSHSMTGSSKASTLQGQRMGGTEELKRLAAAVEALKFVELK